MSYIEANNFFTKKELRAIAKARGVKLYSYLWKIELSHRIFGLDSSINRDLCQMNQLRRYKVPLPSDPKQWNVINA